MYFDSNKEIDAQESRLYLERLISEKRAFELTPDSSGCSLDQNKYLQVLLKYFGASFGWTRSEVEKVFFKTYVNSDLYYFESVDENGIIYQVERSLLELSEADMALAIERFRNYSAMVAGLYLPTKDDKEAMQECKKIIYLNKLFL